MRMFVIGCLLGFLAVSVPSYAHADATSDALKKIIEDLKTNPPASEGDHVVGEMLC